MRATQLGGFGELALSFQTAQAVSVAGLGRRRDLPQHL